MSIFYLSTRTGTRVRMIPLAHACAVTRCLVRECDVALNLYRGCENSLRINYCIIIKLKTICNYVIL